MNTTTRGLNISAQRIDSLEQTLIEHIKYCNEIQKSVFYLELGYGDGALFKRIESSISKALLVDLLPAPIEFLNNYPDHQFLNSSFENLIHYDLPIQPNIIVAQRSLHYIPFLKAKKLLSKILNHCESNTFGIITLSSLHSEHSNDYLDSTKPIAQRFCKLSNFNQNKHFITEPICLYHVLDIPDLLDHPQIKHFHVGLSTFGNIKILFNTY